MEARPLVRVHVRLHTTLRRVTPQGIVDRLDVELEPGATVAALLEHLQVQSGGRSLLLVVNGRPVSADHVLNEGDEVRLVPGISGGCKSRVFPAHTSGHG